MKSFGPANQTTENSMKLSHIIADAIGLIAIFGTAYAALLIGHGLGL